MNNVQKVKGVQFKETGEIQPKVHSENERRGSVFSTLSERSTTSQSSRWYFCFGKVHFIAAASVLSVVELLLLAAIAGYAIHNLLSWDVIVLDPAKLPHGDTKRFWFLNSYLILCFCALAVADAIHVYGVVAYRANFLIPHMVIQLILILGNIAKLATLIVDKAWVYVPFFLSFVLLEICFTGIVYKCYCYIKAAKSSLEKKADKEDVEKAIELEYQLQSMALEDRITYGV